MLMPGMRVAARLRDNGNISDWLEAGGPCLCPAPLGHGVAFARIVSPGGLLHCMRLNPPSLLVGPKSGLTGFILAVVLPGRTRNAWLRGARGINPPPSSSFTAGTTGHQSVHPKHRLSASVSIEGHLRHQCSSRYSAHSTASTSRVHFPLPDSGRRGIRPGEFDPSLTPETKLTATYARALRLMVG